MTILTALPVLLSQDIDQTIAWWSSKLGFEAFFRHGNYAGLRRDGVAIHISGMDDPQLARTVGEQTMLRFVVRDLQAFYDEFKQRGGEVHPNGDIGMRPWGQLEFAVIDPCGVCVTFQQANHA